MIKTIGDEIMCQFPSSQAAVLASNEMHKYVTNESVPAFGRQLSIRIGAHCGSVILTEGDAFGDTVNVSARTAALASAGKTMITESCFKALPADLQGSCRFMMESQVKGKEQPIKLYDVVWEVNDQLTRMAATPRERLTDMRLVAEYEGRSTILEQGALRIGRGLECDMIVEAPQASRCHCEIRHNGNKFPLTDGSTNGTFVLQNDVELFFHNETVPLHHSGTISLGQNCKENSEHLIRFTIESM